MDQAGKSKKRGNLQAIAERSTDGLDAFVDLSLHPLH